ncbi:hypothetical protein Pmani_028412 [Petrolisthes manimaculis]|uniref:Uncharacterized protein n=1 Tax=Petrolisthes manimaculis TaxID=1843537 RepID=A0AAE1TVQ3_9EUCA|nr:hypothetical protein Pmani_028412 [Petrolisthes manimaculis]
MPITRKQTRISRHNTATNAAPPRPNYSVSTAARERHACVYQVEDFVLVQLTLEEGRGVGTLVCYVAQVLSMKEGGRLNLSFFRMKSAVTRDTFTFPNVQDEAEVDPGQCLGVLKVAKGITKRQADLVKVFPPLLPFNMYI